MTRVVVDTNVVLRFLTETPPEHFRRASALFKSAEEGKIEIVVSVLVLAEAWAVLVHSMNKTPTEASEGLSNVMRLRGVDAEDSDNVLTALDATSPRIDFVDAYTALRAQQLNLPVASFDRDFPKRLGARVHPL